MPKVNSRQLKIHRNPILVSVQGVVFHPLKNQTLGKTDSIDLNKRLPVTACFYLG
jgi:hypothetical protein